MRPVYLDCNATTPMEPEVVDVVMHYMVEEFGNAGSRTHEYGARAKQAVEHARDQVAAVVDATRDEVIFTSGATESNNLAILGLAPEGERTNRKHIVSTQIEHKAVLEPLQELSRRGFEVTLVPPTSGGWVEPEAVQKALRPDTLLVSVMHVNNETGVIQPLEDICKVLVDHPAWFHVDAAQGFGKELPPLRNKRIEIISISAHKIYGPKGVGALVLRKRSFKKPPIEPLMFGGGQERGLRPGTVAVPLVAGLGKAAELAIRDHGERNACCARYKTRLVAALVDIGAQTNGDQARALPHVLNVSVPAVDSEAVIVATKDLVSISNGSACTSQDYTPSHVLGAMKLPADRAAGALRFSISHHAKDIDWTVLHLRLCELC